MVSLVDRIVRIFSLKSSQVASANEGRINAARYHRGWHLPQACPERSVTRGI